MIRNKRKKGKAGNIPQPGRQQGVNLFYCILHLFSPDTFTERDQGMRGVTLQLNREGGESMETKVEAKIIYLLTT